MGNYSGLRRWRADVEQARALCSAYARSVTRRVRHGPDPPPLREPGHGLDSVTALVSFGPFYRVFHRGEPWERNLEAFLAYRTALAGRSSSAAKVLAASACIPGRTCWYVAMVKPGVECPNRSLTTLMGTPALRSNVAWV